MRTFAATAGCILVSGLLTACTKGYRFPEAVYNASQTQNQLNAMPPGGGGKQDMNYQQYESERKHNP